MSNSLKAPSNIVIEPDTKPNVMSDDASLAEDLLNIVQLAMVRERQEAVR